MSLSDNTESDQSDAFITLHGIEESIARYGQIVLWLDRMSRTTHDPELRKRLKFLSEQAVKEFDSRILKPMIKWDKNVQEDNLMKVKRMDDERAALKGSIIKRVFDE